MEKVIVTGSKGFIAKNLIKEIDDKYDLVFIDEDIFNNEKWYVNLKKILFQFQPDIIFHVGACSDTLESDANYMMIRNYEFTRILSDWSKDNHSKLIYSSSAANYGTNNLYPSNLYGWSKYVAEQYVIKNGGIALRYFNVYGPLEGHKGKMASVAYQMLEKQKNGQEIKIYPKKPQRDFVYVKDVVNANVFAAKWYSDYSGDWYEVGSGDARTFEDVLDILKIDYTYTNENDIPIGYQFFTQSDSNKWMYGWKPQYNLENGLKDYLTYL